MGENNKRAAAGGINWRSAWILRPVMGIAMIAVVLAALFFGTVYFAALMAVMVIAAALEWHRLVGQGRYLLETLITAVTIVAALGALLLVSPPRIAWIVLLGGTGISVMLSGFRQSRGLWHSWGVLYLGVPALSIVSLRMFSGTDWQDGAWIVAGVLLTVWAADTGALVFGKLLGGPKLAPVLSPNKTWAGTIGGVITGAAAQGLYIYYLGGDVPPALVYGAVLAVVAHAGDLFESWAKRKFHVKDSGSLIPGHGGILDRVDSSLAAGSFAALLVLLIGNFDPLFGAIV